MPSLSFKKRFEPHIRSGRKRHSIRDKRKRPWKVGDDLYLFTGMRTKSCQRIADTACVKVDDIIIQQGPNMTLLPDDFRVFVNGERLAADEKENLAYADGFESFKEMMSFWEGRLPFNGDLIHWSEINNFYPSRSSIASLGGKARARKLSKKQRSEIARKAVNTRWKRSKDE